MNVKRESIIARSPTGTAVITFENETLANKWIEKNPSHRLKFYKQIITEEEVSI